MAGTVFKLIVLALGLAFAAAFAVIIGPHLLADGDVIGGLKAGFVNPYATGYSLDTIICGLILIAWIVYERLTLGVRHGWVCVLLSFMPGVATGFALYLVLRMHQLTPHSVQEQS